MRISDWSSDVCSSDLLESAGVFVLRADDGNELPETVRAAALLVFNSNRAVAVLIGQKVLGIEDFIKGANVRKLTKTTPLNRRKSVVPILPHRCDALLMASMGKPTHDTAAAGNEPSNVDR